jgi:xanthine/CO dehydrogenase XdhC/CoxF family maturation factor
MHVVLYVVLYLSLSFSLLHFDGASPLPAGAVVVFSADARGGCCSSGCLQISDTVVVQQVCTVHYLHLS